MLLKNLKPRVGVIVGEICGGGACCILSSEWSFLKIYSRVRENTIKIVSLSLFVLSLALFYVFKEGGGE